MARIPKINARETKAAAWVTKAETRVSAANKNGHKAAVKRIGRNIKRVQKREALGHKVVARITSKCGSGSSTGTSSGTSVS